MTSAHFPPFDSVNRPKHYNQGEIECIDAIRAALTPDEFRGYLKGNSLKYLWRADLKGGLEDLQKAQWYINQEIGRRLGESRVRPDAPELDEATAALAERTEGDE